MLYNQTIVCKGRNQPLFQESLPARQQPMRRCCLVPNLHCMSRSIQLPSSTYHMSSNQTIVCSLPLIRVSLQQEGPMLRRRCWGMNLHCTCRSTPLPSSTHHMLYNQTIVCKVRNLPLFQESLVARQQPMRRCCLVPNLHCMSRSIQLPSSTYHMARNQTIVCSLPLIRASLQQEGPMLRRRCWVMNLHCTCRSTPLPSSTHHMLYNQTIVCKVRNLPLFQESLPARQQPPC